MGQKNNHHEHHVIPVSVFMNVFYALVALTALTVVTAKFMSFGKMDAFVAFSIAAVKATLVMMYFMHLKYDSIMNRVIILGSFFFVLLLYIFSVLDIFTRIPQHSTL